MVCGRDTVAAIDGWPGRERIFVTMSLEWSSPAGPAALGLLAGPWRRSDVADGDPTEVFRARVSDEGPTRLAADPLRTLVTASSRLRAAFQPNAPGAGLARAEAELLRTLAGDTAGPNLDVSPWLAELARRGTALARVETTYGRSPGVVTTISTTGDLVMHMLAEAPAALLMAHRRAVAAALHTRATLLRAALTTAELAALIVALTGPAAAAVALPLAWRFLHTLLAEPNLSPGD